MRTAAIYAAAARAEIAGCFAFWAWLRLGYRAFWAVAGVASLVVFAWLLTLVVMLLTVINFRLSKRWVFYDN